MNTSPLLSNKSRITLTLGILYLSLLSGSSSLAQTITDLGQYTNVQDINADGSVVVGYYGSDPEEAFRWTSTSGIHLLGALPGGLRSRAFAVSEDGLTVVGWSQSSSGDRAFRWTSKGGMESLGVLSGGSVSYANDANFDGTVIVGSSESVFGYRAFRWSESSGMQSLGVLLGGTRSEGTSISADGQTIVGSGNSKWGFNNTIRWNPDNGMQIIGLFDGAPYSQPTAVSSNGQVIVGLASNNTNGGSFWAFRWSISDGLIPLCDIGSIANGANENGSAIVGYCNCSPTVCPTLWLNNVSSVNLNNWLPTQGVDLSNWVLHIAEGISTDGKAIIGSGLHIPNNFNTVWIVNLTCPVSLVASGDGDANGTTDGADIPNLINFLVNDIPPDGTACAYDMNSDGVVNMADLPLFVGRLMN